MKHHGKSAVQEARSRAMAFLESSFFALGGEEGSPVGVILQCRRSINFLCLLRLFAAIQFSTTCREEAQNAQKCTTAMT
jgi:hypothetical protein